MSISLFLTGRVTRPNVPFLATKGPSTKAAEATVVAEAQSASVARYQKLFKPISEFDVTKTLYRGTTGSEASSTVLFLTEDATVAATYVKKWGQGDAV